MIPFLDLHAINERYRNEIDARIKFVLDSGWYLEGTQMSCFLRFCNILWGKICFRCC